MKQATPAELKELAIDIDIELTKLARLREEIEKVSQLIDDSPELADLLYENQALKLHNFYNGCERIFRIVASELNGAVPDGYDWHKRLLERMGVPHEGRPALLSPETIRLLEKFLAFRHMVRNIYGFELETERVVDLVAQHAVAWQFFEANARQFIAWLKEIAEQLE